MPYKNQLQQGSGYSYYGTQLELLLYSWHLFYK